MFDWIRRKRPRRIAVRKDLPADLFRMMRAEMMLAEAYDNARQWRKIQFALVTIGKMKSDRDTAAFFENMEAKHVH